MKTFRHTFSITCLLLPFLLMGQAGSLDTDFNTIGYLVTGTTGVTDNAKAVAIQADGRIVTSGFTGTAATADFDVYRFHTDGSWDPTFDGDGHTSTDISGDLDAAWGVAVQPDGKIVVAGISNTFTIRMALVRYNSDGSLDNSFATQGISTVNFGGVNDQAQDMVLQDDGKIVAVGWSDQGNLDGDFAIARWKSDGTLDSSFNIDGTAIIDVGVLGGAARSVVVQPDGKIVLGGFSQNASNWAMQLVRLNSDGTLDNSFNGTGKLRIEVNSVDDACRALALQPDGKIIAIGYSSVGFQYDAALVRVNANGTLDNSFSGDGMMTVPVGTGSDILNTGYVQADGRIVCAGYSYVSGSGLDPLVMRVNSDGTMDNSFGINGSTTTAVVGTDDDEINKCVPDADGNIVAAGVHTQVGTQDRQALVLRYLSDLDIGVLEHTNTNMNTLIYPNPLADVATLEFELLESGPVTIELLDLQGRSIHVFQQAVRTPIGEQQVSLRMPEALTKGSYLIKISSDNGSTTVRIMN